MSDEDILTELDLSDEHATGQVRLLVYQTADYQLHVYDGPDTGVTVDFNQSCIRLSKVHFLVDSVHCGINNHVYSPHRQKSLNQSIFLY